MTIHRRTLLAASSAAFIAPAFAQSPTYPSKPVNIVVPFAPGGGSDNVGRLIAARLSERTKANFVVDNKPGAGTNIGNDWVAKAAPDGHTLLLAQTTLSINPSLYKSLRYNVSNDLMPIALIAVSPTVLVVNNNFPAKTLQEFRAYAKANPGKVNYGSGGAGTSVHLAGELFETLTETFMVHIPYRGSAPAVTDLIGGQIQAIFDTAPSALPHVKGGRVRALAVTGAKRLADLPDVPTFAELGIPQFDAPAWYGLMAPAKTPAAIISSLHGHVQDILKEPATLQRIAQLGAVATSGSPENFSAFLQTETQRWGNVIRTANVAQE